MNAAREKILARIGDALGQRGSREHPGAFEGRPSRPGAEPTPVNRFREAFESAGGEVVAFPSQDDARAWLADFAGGFRSVVFGATVPASLRIGAEETDPSLANLAVSIARCAVAETGTLVLDARDGREVQLLPPAHLVFVWADTLHATLLEFLEKTGDSALPSALGLHSGPSSSADIGQVVVKGIHGPGRIIAAILEWDGSG